MTSSGNRETAAETGSSARSDCDSFRLEDLPLPRPAGGYAVQRLGRDAILDRRSKAFLPIRHPRLDGLFSTFAEARQAAREWLRQRGDILSDEAPVAIVPAAFDPVFGRHVLIFGVLPSCLTAEETALYVTLRPDFSECQATTDAAKTP